MAGISIYSPELIDEICALIMGGKSVRAICSDPKMPSEAIFYRWLSQNKDNIVEKYARACEIRTEHYAEDIVPIADEVAGCTDNAVVQAAKLRIETRKWDAAKRLPRKYGDRLEMTGAGGSPLIPQRVDDPDRIAQAVMLMVQAPGSRPALPAPSRARVIDNSIEDSGDGTDDATG